MDETTTEIVGPFPEYYRAVVYGYVVPNIKCYRHDGGIIQVVLDDRIAILVPEASVAFWMPLVADAMAFGAGFSCAGENSSRLNPYKRHVISIDASGS